MNVMQAELKKSQTVMRNQLDATTDEHRSMVELMKKTKNHTTSVHKDIKQVPSLIFSKYVMVELFTDLICIPDLSQISGKSTQLALKGYSIEKSD